MADAASLVVRVSAQGVSSVRNELRGLTDSAKSAAAAVGAVVSVSAGMSKLVQTARQTDILTASLKTMTGSSENAAMAFSELQKFAAQTPYTLDQSVQAFTKLVSLGLNPSQKAIESYGNTAAAMGKDLTQMIEAVADATTGEFERLKEFGIKAKQQGDQVSFTFQGVTTTVGKNAAEIEGYLQGLGNNQFAGAMANRMATLDGALSNLQDSWDGLFRAISSAGTGEAIAEQVRYASSALDDLNAAISSGEALGLITAWGNQWESTFKDLKSMISDADKYLQETLQGWGLSASESSSFMSDAFWQFPANVKAAIQISTVELAGFVDKAKIYADKIDAYLTPSNIFYDGDIGEYYDKQLKVVDGAVRSTTDGIISARQRSIDKLDEEKRKAYELRAAYDEKSAQPSVDLGKFSKAATPTASTASGSDKTQKQIESDAKRLQSQKDSAAQYLTQLQQSNMTELQLIDSQEQQKLAKIEEYRAQSLDAEGKWRANGLISLQEYEDAKDEIEKNAAASRQKLVTDEIDAHYKQMSDSRKYDLDQREKERNRKQKIIDDGINAQRNMTNDLRNVLGEQNDLYKASAIVTATINTYQAATAAYMSASQIPFVGWIMGPVAAGAAIAAGLANIAAIKGAREQGGGMMAGSAYQMAERGKAEIIVPAGASRARTAAQMRDIMGQNGGKSSPSSVVIVNQTTGRIDSVQQEQTSEGQLRLIIREEVSAGLLTQDSQIAKARRQTSGQPGY